jgi:hypothetical protein
MGRMGWSDSGMGVRYQHLTNEVRRDIAKQVGGLIWQAAKIKPAKSEPDQPDDGEDGAAGSLVRAS